MILCPFCDTGLGAAPDVGGPDDLACRCGLVYARFDAAGSPGWNGMTVWVDVTALPGLHGNAHPYLRLRRSSSGLHVVQDSMGNEKADPAAALAEYLREAACLLVMES